MGSRAKENSVVVEIADPEHTFELERDHFRNETSNATCSYCMPRAVAFAARDRLVHRALNQAALFWNLSATACQLGLFVVWGRIFDQSSPHNIDALIRIASSNPVIFGKSALEVQAANQKGPRWADPLKAWGDMKHAPNWKQLREARQAAENKSPDSTAVKLVSTGNPRPGRRAVIDFRCFTA